MLIEWRLGMEAADPMRTPRATAFCKRGSVNVPFAPKTTDLLRCRRIDAMILPALNGATDALEIFPSV